MNMKKPKRNLLINPPKEVTVCMFQTYSSLRILLVFLLYFHDYFPRHPIYIPIVVLVNDIDIASAAACHQKVIFPNSHISGMERRSIF